jgi:hypothetical protein
MDQTANLHAPLLLGISQYDVDFVIPRIGVDTPVGIDPFLLYKSRDAEYRQLHALLLAAFNSGIDAVRSGATARARTILDFPEVAAIGFGYTQGGKRGSGVGSHMTTLILETLEGSPGLQERGVRHVEEMQLLSPGIGPDRVSDIAANVLKRFLIRYTQRQCDIWDLARKTNVPVGHIYDPGAGGWVDSYEDLPVSPVDGSPILLVPRRIVRVLPWINYDDFVKTEFSAYLGARRAKARSATGSGPSGVESKQTKREVVTVTRSDIALVERYVRSREQQGRDAKPALNYIDQAARDEAENLKHKFRSIRAGREQATVYQRLVLEALNFLFSPELIDGQPEVKTFEGTERRDIVFTNDSDESFWEYVRTEHAGIFIMFEAKNTDVLDLAAINQTATYLGDRLGRLGVIVTRASPPEAVQRKAFSVWNDSAPNRKVILILTDDHICELLDIRGRDGSPTQWFQRHYRAFRMAVQ